MTSEVTVKVLDSFAEAWDRHDIDGLMSFMRKNVCSRPRWVRISGERAMRAVMLCERDLRKLDNLPDRTVEQCASLRTGRTGCLGVDIHGNATGRSSRRGTGLRSVQLSRRQDRAEEFLPQEPRPDPQ